MQVTLKSRTNPEGVRVFRATVRRAGQVVEMIETKDKRATRRIVRRCYPSAIL